MMPSAVVQFSLCQSVAEGTSHDFNTLHFLYGSNHFQRNASNVHWGRTTCSIVHLTLLLYDAVFLLANKIKGRTVSKMEDCILIDNLCGPCHHLLKDSHKISYVPRGF